MRFFSKFAKNIKLIYNEQIYPPPLFALLISLCIGLLGASCASDEPGGGDNQQQTNIQPVKANIQNASALIAYNGYAESRSIDEEFDRPGLYQLGPDGKVSMVAIYYTTDEDGKKIETQHSLTVCPGIIQSFSKNYILLYRCTYYDEDGNIASVNTSHILIHKLSGEIYDVTSVIEVFPATNSVPCFYEESDGSLLVYDVNSNNIGRISFAGKKATFTQLNNGQGFYGVSGYNTSINTTSSGLIFSADPGLAADMAVLFPNRGYDYLGSHTIPELSNIQTIHQVSGPSANGNYKAFIWLNDSPVAIVRESYYTGNEANESFIENFIGIMKINVGNQAGQVTFSQGATHHLFSEWSETTLYNGAVIGDNLLVEISNSDTNRAYLVYNSGTDKWVDMGSPIKFLRNNIGLNSYAIFNGRAWIVDIPDGARGGKVWWIDPAKQQTGSLDIDLTGVDVEYIEEDYQSGRLIFHGVRRADSYNCVLTFDLTTGKSEQKFSYPNIKSFTLLLLS